MNLDIDRKIKKGAMVDVQWYGGVVTVQVLMRKGRTFTAYMPKHNSSDKVLMEVACDGVVGVR